VKANLRLRRLSADLSRGRSQNRFDVIEDFIDEKREEYEELLEARAEKD
jgi:hypothetical protein